jgi:transposase
MIFIKKIALRKSLEEEIEKQCKQLLYYTINSTIKNIFYRLREEHIVYIQGLLDEDATLTLKNIKDKILENFGIHVSKSTVHNSIVGFHYSLKILTVQCANANTEANQHARRIYSENYCEKRNQERNFIFVDEIGFKVSQRINYGRSHLGEPARYETPVIRSRNITVMAAMTRSNLLCYRVLENNGNAENFRVFLHDVQASSNAAGIVLPIIVLDNVSFHRTGIVHEEFFVLGMESLFLPPYSPFFNPIENMFSKWKNFVKREHPVNEVQLRAAMDNVTHLITPQDCAGYVAKVNENCFQCAFHGQNLFDN